MCNLAVVDGFYSSEPGVVFAIKPVLRRLGVCDGDYVMITSQRGDSICRKITPPSSALILHTALESKQLFSDLNDGVVLSEEDYKLLCLWGPDADRVSVVKTQLNLAIPAVLEE